MEARTADTPELDAAGRIRGKDSSECVACSGPESPIQIGGDVLGSFLYEHILSKNVVVGLGSDTRFSPQFLNMRDVQIAWTGEALIVLGHDENSTSTDEDKEYIWVKGPQERSGELSSSLDVSSGGVPLLQKRQMRY